MKSHLQSSDTTSTSIGRFGDTIGRAGSRLCDPIHATPPRKRTTSAGIAQTSTSSFPEYAQVGRYVAALLEARNHQAKKRVASMVGTTMTSIMPRASRRTSLSPSAIGPTGERIVGVHPPVTAAVSTRPTTEWKSWRARAPLPASYLLCSANDAKDR